MKNSKEIVKKTLPVSNSKTGMWILSLFMNRDNMQDLERAVKLVVIIMCLKFITPRVRLCIGTLNKVIKDFKVKISDEAKAYINTACAEADSHAIYKKKSDYQSEEEIYMKCQVSPFKRHFSEIYKVQLASIENDCQINSLYSPLFFETILSNLFPTIPLWSGLLLGNYGTCRLWKSQNEIPKCQARL